MAKYKLRENYKMNANLSVLCNSLHLAKNILHILPVSCNLFSKRLFLSFTLKSNIVIIFPNVFGIVMKTRAKKFRKRPEIWATYYYYSPSNLYSFFCFKTSARVRVFKNFPFIFVI